MENNIRIADLFDQEHWSDITIEFSGREVKCHKAILSWASNYFYILLGRDNAFEENGQEKISLQGDDPDALYGLLKFIYTMEYPVRELLPTDKWSAEVFFHLHVATVADKYGIKDLEAQANTQFRRYAFDIKDPERVIDLLDILPQYEYYRRVLTTTEKDIIYHNLPEIIQDSGFRAWLEARPNLAVSCLKRTDETYGLRTIRQHFKSCKGSC